MNGTGAESSAITVTTSTPPDAPTGLSRTYSSGAVTVSFTAPNDGGSAITNYQYSTNNGVTWSEFSPEDATSPVTITGLTNGTTYQIKLRALNISGPGTESSAITATPSTTPNAPTSLSTTNANQRVTVNFTVPNDGGSAITNYEYSINNGTSWITPSPSVITSPVTITGLTNGTTYQIKLRALNINGNGTESSAITATPQRTPPSAPTISSTSWGAANSRFTIYFTLPTDNGGNNITNYEYSLNDGTSWIAFSPQDISSPAITQVGSAPNGTSYQIKLRAVNINGPGAASDAVTGDTSPSAPTDLTVVSTGDRTITIGFNVPSYVGSGITNYQYSTNDGSTWFAFSPLDIESPVTITSGLTNGTLYKVRLRAVAGSFTGSQSGSIEATPSIPSI